MEPVLRLFAEEGFPRADVDIVAIRHARSRYAKLQTDYSRIMARIEAGLEALHNLPLPEGVGPPSPATTARTSAASSSDGALARSTDASSAQPTPSIGITVAQPASLGVDALAPPVAVVNGVLPDGPAHMAGMRSGMEVLRFGTATAESLAASGQGLDALWGIAAASAGRDVEVVARLSTDRAAETLAAGAGSSVSALGAHLRLLLVRVPSPPRLGLHLVLPTSEPDTA